MHSNHVVEGGIHVWGDAQQGSRPVQGTLVSNMCR